VGEPGDVAGVLAEQQGLEVIEERLGGLRVEPAPGVGIAESGKPVVGVDLDERPTLDRNAIVGSLYCAVKDAGVWSIDCRSVTPRS